MAIPPYSEPEFKLMKDKYFTPNSQIPGLFKTAQHPSKQLIGSSIDRKTLNSRKRMEYPSPILHSTARKKHYFYRLYYRNGNSCTGKIIENTIKAIKNSFFK